LSSSSDGASLSFASTLRLKGDAPLLNGKAFVSTSDGVQLFRARERSSAPAGSPCTVGGFADYLAAETAAGAVALSYTVNALGGCSFPPNLSATEIVSASGSANIPGVVRLSPTGRYAIVFLASTARIFNSVAISFLDLQTGAQIPVAIEAPAFPQYVRVPVHGGRVIANDGTALIGITDGGAHHSGYLVKSGSGPQPFPVPDALPLLIDANASKVVYQSDGLRLLDLQTGASSLLIPADQTADGLNLSDDGRLLLFLRAGQVHLLDTAMLTDRVLTNEPATVTEATLSGDGKVAYAVTGRGELLKFQTGDGTRVEVIGHTPYLKPVSTTLTPGLTATLDGSGLSDSIIDGTPPLNPYLGNVTMWIGERKVPMIQLAPNHVRFLPPWDISGRIRILAEAPGEHTPFYFPEVETVAADISYPRAGAIARQDWQPTFSGPVNTGEIIHVYAIGFGAVSPETPEGAAAPSAEPFSRITRALTCTNAEILYAGLAPGTVERVYQIDLRIGPIAGYQKFTCTLDGSDPFVFLTLNVLAAI
jgi:uncharacterized protein (TIGR03437 family)